jgi:aryl-alcohol dehydrogenase-like predicted oxidoreductase
VRLKREELGWLAERLFTEQNESRVKKLMTFAADHGFSLPQLGIAWCLKNENVSTVILGATKASQLKETLKSRELVQKLTPEIMNDIELILNNKPVHPQF